MAQPPAHRFESLSITNRGMAGTDEEEALLLSGVDRVRANRTAYLTREKLRKLLICGGLALAGASVLAMILGLTLGRRHRFQDFAAQCPPGFKRDEYETVFFVVGDWGRSNANQQKVADMMGSLGDRCYKPSFVVSTGDNFYSHGLKGPHDPYFKQTFSDMYSAPSLQVPWYAVLGNHDYGEANSALLWACASPSFDTCPKDCCLSAAWQANMTGMDWRWNLRQGAWRQTYLDGLLDILYIDTPPFIAEYWSEGWAKSAGGISSQDVDRQKAAIQQLLSSSKAPWKLVVGHHPIESYGEHCDFNGKGQCNDMQFLKPWLQQHKVAAYFCGHEHDLQLIKSAGSKDNPLFLVVSGGGSDIRPGEFEHPQKDAEFLADQQGFVAVAIQKSSDTMTFFYHGSETSPGPAHTSIVKRPS